MIAPFVVTTNVEERTFVLSGPLEEFFLRMLGLTEKEILEGSPGSANTGSPSLAAALEDIFRD